MVKITIVGRVNDGLPLAEGPRFVNDENDSFSAYKQQGEFILQEISRGALPYPQMTIRIDHHCFSYIIENGICFMTLCESSYPRKLSFFYLHDLAKEFDKFDKSIVQQVKRPYSFVRCGTVIGNLRKQYLDTRTQANLSKLKGKYVVDNDVKTDDFSQVVKRRKRAGMLEQLAEAQQEKKWPIWGYKRLEDIALKWTPISILLVVAATLLWSCSSILGDHFS